MGLGLSARRFLRFVRSARFLRGARRGPARPYLLAFSAHRLRPSLPPSRTHVLSCARRARPPPRWRQERLFNTLRWRCAAPAVHCGTRPRKVSRPQFRRTQRASGLRPSRRSLPRGLHGPDRELDRYHALARTSATSATSTLSQRAERAAIYSSLRARAGRELAYVAVARLATPWTLLGTTDAPRRIGFPRLRAAALLSRS